MKRRTALRLAVGSLTGLAGCVSAGYGPPASDETDTNTPTTSQSRTATETKTQSPTETPPPDPPSIVGRNFQVTERACGTGDGGAHPSLDGPRIVVEGTAIGSDGCETARLDSATYDPETDTLTVVVGVYRPDGAAACTQCLTDIDYRLTVRFESGTPGNVRVVHENAVVEESTVG